jgi:hypothetical protein
MYSYDIMNKHIIENLSLHVCTTLGDSSCLMYEIINFGIAMLHFVLFQNLTHYFNSMISHIHANTTKFVDIMCILPKVWYYGSYIAPSFQAFPCDQVH